MSCGFKEEEISAMIPNNEKKETSQVASSSNAKGGKKGADA